MLRTRASSGRSVETVAMSSRIEAASAVAVDSPAAARAAAKYLMVTSGIWEKPHKLVKCSAIMSACCCYPVCLGPPAMTPQGPDVQKDRIADRGSDDQHKETA